MAEEKIGLRFVVDGRGAAVGAMGSVRSSLISVRGAALATGAAIFGVAHALSSSIDEAREAERTGKVTEARLKSTGHAANVTARQIGNLATAISKKSGIDDEAIQSGENLLLTFTKIRNEQGKGNKIFNQATQAVTDLSAAMAGSNSEVDLKSASIQIGKALNDPIKGVAALGRVGVSFDDQQKKLIATLVQSGRTMDAQKIILRELRTEFGGTAAAQATMGDKVKVAWGNIEEQLGTAILPLVDEVERAFMRKGVPAIQHYLDVFQDRGVPAIKNFVDESKPVVEEIIPAIGSGLHTIAGALKTAAPYAKDMIKAFNNAPDWVKKGLVLGAGGTLLAKKIGVTSLASRVAGGALGKYGGATPVYVVNEGFGGAGGLGGPAGGVGATLGGKGLPGAGLLPILPALGSQVIRPGDNGMKALTLPGSAMAKLGPFQSLLFDPTQMANASRGLRDLLKGTSDLGAGFLDARDKGDRLKGAIDLIDGRQLSLDPSRAERALMALDDRARQVAADVAAAAASILNFGGSAPAAPSSPSSPSRPKGPRVPSVPTSKPPTTPTAAGRMAASGTTGDPIVLQVNLDGKVLAESTVQHLGNRQARR